MMRQCFSAFLAFAVVLLLGTVAFVSTDAAISTTSVGSQLIGDFDGDLDRDGDDADLLSLSGDLSRGYVPNANELQFDLNGDFYVDLMDMVEWLRLGTIIVIHGGPTTTSGPTIMGDADLDGDVDKIDWEIFFTNYELQQQSPGHLGFWTRGDFNCNGTFDLEDVEIWSRAATVN